MHERLNRISPLNSPLKLVPCCVCDILDARPIGVGEDFEYHTCCETFVALQCNRCDLVMLNPRPSVLELERIYPETYHAFQFTPEAFGFVHSVRRRLEARRLLQGCKSLASNSRILDIGCGDGFHLELLRKFGNSKWVLEGVDVSRQAVERARQSGLTVHHGRLEDMDFPSESFDMIFLIATIEHVENPAQVLENVRRLLKSGGRCVIITDNTKSPDFRIWRNRYWGGYHFPRHWNLFNANSVNLLATKVLLDVEQWETLVSPVNWVYSIRNWLVDHAAPQLIIRQFSLKSPVTLAVFTLWDSFFQLWGRGALMRVTLRKPA